MIDRHIRVAGLLLLMVIGFAGSSSAITVEEEFQRANRYYEAKRYDRAIDQYHQILQRGVESATIYFNLGNAYFRKGDLGHAVLNYMRAHRVDPADEDIRHNLEFARGFSAVQMEGVTLNPIQQFLESIVGPYRLNTLGWVASGVFVLFVISLIFRYGLGYSGPLIRAAIIASLILTIAMSGLTTFKYQGEYLTVRAVILADDSPVRTGPTQQSEVELQGAPGLVVEIIDERDGFYNVLFENKRRGWINKDLVALI